MSGEEEWKARILVNENWTSLVKGLNGCTSKVAFLIQQKLSEEELALPFDGALYFPLGALRFFPTKRLDEEVEKFEKFVSFVGGIEGKCLAIWVDKNDRDMKDSIVEKLHLKERSCEWYWDYFGDDDERVDDFYLRIGKFFEENTQQQYQIKPAKR